jgi:hypothetical protein
MMGPPVVDTVPAIIAPAAKYLQKFELTRTGVAVEVDDLGPGRLEVVEVAHPVRREPLADLQGQGVR